MGGGQEGCGGLLVAWGFSKCHQHTHACVHLSQLSAHVRMLTCAFLLAYATACAHAHACAKTRTSAHVCAYIHMCIRMYTCTHPSTSVHTCKHQHNEHPQYARMGTTRAPTYSHGNPIHSSQRAAWPFTASLRKHTHARDHRSVHVLVHLQLRSWCGDKRTSAHLQITLLPCERSQSYNFAPDLVRFDEIPMRLCVIGEIRRALDI